MRMNNANEATRKGTMYVKFQKKFKKETRKCGNPNYNHQPAESEEVLFFLQFFNVFHFHEIRKFVQTSFDVVFFPLQ